MGRQFLYGLILLAICSGCSVRRFLPEGERLYRGPTIEVLRQPKTKTSERLLRKQLKLAVRPKANKFFFWANPTKYGGGMLSVSPNGRKVFAPIFEIG